MNGIPVPIATDRTTVTHHTIHASVTHLFISQFLYEKRAYYSLDYLNRRKRAPLSKCWNTDEYDHVAYRRNPHGKRSDEQRLNGMFEHEREYLWPYSVSSSRQASHSKSQYNLSEHRTRHSHEELARRIVHLHGCSEEHNEKNDIQDEYYVCDDVLMRELVR